jgi:hypothetical protein
LAGGNIDKLGILVCLLPSFTPIHSNPRRNASFGPRPIQQKSNIPDLVIILNPSENLGLIRECTTMKVPTVGIVDTHTDPRVVTYAIPANMEVSLRSHPFVLGTHYTDATSRNCSPCEHQNLCFRRSLLPEQRVGRSGCWMPLDEVRLCGGRCMRPVCQGLRW